LIERRGKADLLIFFGLCIFTLWFIYVLFYYIKPKLSFSGAVEEIVPEDPISQ
jgi:hypothetical protein